MKRGRGGAGQGARPDSTTRGGGGAARSVSSVPTDTTRRRPRPPEDGPARRPEGGFTLRGGSAARTAELRGGGV